MMDAQESKKVSSNVGPIKRIEREFHRNMRQKRAAVDILRRFPSQILGWRRAVLQDNVKYSQ